MSTPITINLTNDEGVVLFELLARINSTKTENFFEHKSEQTVLSTIEAQLESILSEPFKSNYLEIVNQARQRIIETSN